MVQNQRQKARGRQKVGVRGMEARALEGKKRGQRKNAERLGCENRAGGCETRAEEMYVEKERAGQDSILGRTGSGSLEPAAGSWPTGGLTRYLRRAADC